LFSSGILTIGKLVLGLVLHARVVIFPHYLHISEQQ